MRKEPRTTGITDITDIDSAASATPDDDDGTEFRTVKSYLLPIEGHISLRLLRDELRLLSTLAEPRNEDDRDDILLSTEALSDCFCRIAGQLDEVLGGVSKVR